jgi:outer membrane protein
LRRYFFAILLLLTLFSINALALTWGEAVTPAEKNNNELISARKDLEASEWTYRKSYSVFLPQLSASVGLSNSQSTTSGAWSDSYSYGLSASQSLFRGMQGIYSIQSAYASLEYQKASLRSTRASLFYELRSAFLNLLVAQENIKLLEEILKQRQKNSQLIQLRYESGKEDKGNLMTTQADEKEAEHDLSSAKRDLKLAQLKLSQMLDLEVKSVEEPNASAKPAEANFDELLKDTPAYVIAQKQLEAAELSQKASISGFLPSLSLSGSYRKSGDDWPPDTSSKSWSLSLSYSFFPGGSNVAERAIEGAQLDAAREDFAQSVKDLRYSLEEAFQNYEDAIEALGVVEVSLAASQERAKITEVKYLNGLTGYDEWYRIENTYIQAQKSMLTSRKSALLAEALWHKTYGGYVQ